MICNVFKAITEALIFRVNNGTGYINYDWNRNILDGMANPSDLSIGAYLVTVTDENNCTAQSDSILISQPEQLLVNLALDPNENEILYRDTILAIAIPSADEEAIVNTVWSPEEVLAGAAPGSILEQYISPLSNIEFTVMIEDTSGCVAFDTTSIKVSKDFPFYVPNAFAPQSSHSENALFRPFATHKVRNINSFRIFNRWGDMVHERINFQGDDDSAAWDGTFNGKALPSGVFVYFLEVEFIDGALEVFSGDVLLVR